MTDLPTQRRAAAVKHASEANLSGFDILGPVVVEMIRQEKADSYLAGQVHAELKGTERVAQRIEEIARES